MIAQVVLRDSRRIREFLPRLRPAQIELHNFSSLVNRVLKSTLAFVMRMLPAMKGIHETNIWNIAGRRSLISNDTLDRGAASRRNPIRYIGPEGALQFL